MAIMDDDERELVKIFGKDASRDRFQNWLWHFLCIRTKSMQLRHYGPSAVNFMLSLLKEDPYIRNEVISCKDVNLIPESYFSWLGDEFRQTEWVLKKLMFESDLKFNFSELHHVLVGRQKIVAIIDCGSLDALNKIALVQKLERDWTAHVAGDRAYDWFKKKDEVERCEFFWDWLVKNYVALSFGQPKFKIYQDVLVYFDNSPVLNSDKLLMLERVKKAWSQKQYRQNLEGKRQCNLILSEKAVKLLDHLSGKHGLTRSQIVELLIRDEHEKEVYISERLGVKRKLLS